MAAGQKRVSAASTAKEKEEPLKDPVKRLRAGAKKITDAKDSITEDHEKDKEELSPPGSKKSQDDDNEALVALSSKQEGNFFGPEVTKADRSTFLVMAKRSKDPNIQQALLEYQALDRFDEKKSNIIALWKKDKSCQWWNGWHKEQAEGEAVKMDDFAGYGTMKLSRICWIDVCVGVVLWHFSCVLR